ncbi:MAG: hypothetical protein L3J97_07905, partial [Thermoplasmata archaeon]|nr:hypothetical protein [Thermoplasmata archaeon]
RLCSAVLVALLSGLSASALVVQASLDAKTCGCSQSVCCSTHRPPAGPQRPCHGSEPARTLQCPRPVTQAAVSIPSFLLPRATPLKYALVVSQLPPVPSFAPRAGFHRIDSPPPKALHLT